MKRKLLALILVISASSSLFCGCNSKSTEKEITSSEQVDKEEQQEEIPEEPTEEPEEQIEEVEQLAWTEVGSLTANEKTREVLDEWFFTKGETGSKQGILYEIPSDTPLKIPETEKERLARENSLPAENGMTWVPVEYSETDEERYNTRAIEEYTDDQCTNNNTLNVALHNYRFREIYKLALEESAKAARENDKAFEDIDDEIVFDMMLNDYFQILPSTDDQHNLDEELTRAQVMAAVMRAITPVDTTLETNKEFTKKVGATEYNLYAQILDGTAYLSTEDGSLNTENYQEPMTRAEVVYLLVNRFYPEDLAMENFPTEYPNNELDDCIDGGDYTSSGSTHKDILQKMITEQKLDSEMYEAFNVARFYKIVSAETKWDQPVTMSEFMQMLVTALKGETTTMERFHYRSPYRDTDKTSEEYLKIFLTTDFECNNNHVNGYEHPELVAKPTDYGTKIKVLDDMPYISPYGWDQEVHPGYFALTDKKFMCFYDGLTHMTYYANMETPTGTFFGGDKENIAIGNYMDEKGYNTCMEITYEEMVELCGEVDLSTLSEDIRDLDKYR